jgi:hypothetical protein
MLLEEGIRNLRCYGKGYNPYYYIDKMPEEIEEVVALIQLSECHHLLSNCIRRVDTYRTHHNKPEYYER